MIERSIQKAVETSLKTYPVVGLLGPRQIGKTTLAKKIQSVRGGRSIYIDLELPSDQNKLQEPELYLRQFQDSLVVIDEIQRLPSLFPLLRALVDQNRVGGRFLILGSASLTLIKQASESLAGRVIYHEMAPLSLSEVGDENIRGLWLRGGFPQSYLSEDDHASFTWREAFIKTYLEMDLPQLGIRIPAPQIRRFWTMLAHHNAQLWNASQISLSLGVSAPTVRDYLDILEETFIIRRLPPFYANVKKRLIKSPKIYFNDSGLLHALLRTETFDDLQGRPFLGASWESFMISQIAEIIPRTWQMFFYRTGGGAEIDLVLADTENNLIAVEIKYSAAPKPTKGFWSAFEDLGCSQGFIVYPGEESYPIGDNVWVLPAKDLSKIPGPKESRKYEQRNTVL